MALHESQTLTQAIQDAFKAMTEEEAQQSYRYYANLAHSMNMSDRRYTWGSAVFEPLPFHEWLTVNRVRIL